jgi:flavin-dependent dehydrogenase
VRLDVAIIGAGPAGVAAALSLKQLAPDARVALLCSSRLPRRRPVEALVPAARKTLEDLGCWELFKQERFPESFGSRAVWGSEQPYENEFLFSLHGCGWHVNRTRFDSMLLRSAIDAGIEIHRDEKTPPATFGPAAGFVIDASGRSAVYATRQSAVREPSDALVALFAEFKLSEPSDSYTLVEAQEDGWWYSAPFEGSQAIAAWMSDADLVRKGRVREPQCFLSKLAKAGFTGDRLRRAQLLHEPVIHAAQSQRLQPAAGPGWVAAGDAAMTVDPLSSQGILNALRLGRLASFVALDYLQGRNTCDRYQRLLAQDHAAYHKTRLEFYSKEQRWPHSDFWRRRRQSSE